MRLTLLVALIFAFGDVSAQAEPAKFDVEYVAGHQAGYKDGYVDGFANSYRRAYDPAVPDGRAVEP